MDMMGYFSFFRFLSLRNDPISARKFSFWKKLYNFCSLQPLTPHIIRDERVYTIG